jgi:hypothetical protein
MHSATALSMDRLKPSPPGERTSFNFDGSYHFLFNIPEDQFNAAITPAHWVKGASAFAIHKCRNGLK